MKKFDHLRMEAGYSESTVSLIKFNGEENNIYLTLQ